MMLRAIATAPKDGTMVLFVYDDLSGFIPGFWGATDTGETGWFNAEDCDELSVNSMMGWLELPEDVRGLLDARLNKLTVERAARRARELIARGRKDGSDSIQ